MKRYLLLSILFLAGCSSQLPELHITIKLSDDKKSMQIAGFDKTIITDIGRDTTNGVWQALLPVYKMPLDTDMKDFQNAQPGKYAVKDSIVVFTPDTAFKKGQTYFLRSFDYRGTKNAWQTLTDKKRLGAAKHRDLIFSY